MTWLGPLSRQELYADVYPISDVFLYPTRFDCAPLVVVEALAHGVPVVAPRSFGIPTLVHDGSTGLLVGPGRTDLLVEAVTALFRDPGRLRALGAAAADDFESRLSAPVRNRALMAAYEAAMGSRD